MAELQVIPLTYPEGGDFDNFQNQPPGVPREHHLSEVLQGRSKSKFYIS